MLPVACLPICGILMGIGYYLCPSTMQGGEVEGILQQIGFLLVKAGGALIDNMAILFVIGVGAVSYTHLGRRAFHAFGEKGLRDSEGGAFYGFGRRVKQPV